MRAKKDATLIDIFRAVPMTAEEKRVLRRMRDVEGYDGELVRGERGGRRFDG